MSKVKLKIEMELRDAPFLRDVLDEGRRKITETWRFQSLSSHDQRLTPDERKAREEDAASARRRMESVEGVWKAVWDAETDAQAFGMALGRFADIQSAE